MLSTSRSQFHNPRICNSSAAPVASSSASTTFSTNILARDVRLIHLKIVSVGKGNSPGAVLMAEEWAEKVRRYTTLTEVQIKPNPKKTTNVEIQKQAEGEKVLKAVDARDWIVLLDERGRSMKSEDMAQLIGKAGDRGSPVVFCIGGPFGHSDAVRERANESIRLSDMVLNHQVAHVVLLEQVYRGWTILRGEPYHH
ncbi:hypothetical protein CEUSTIGMA_g1839.t1 [Chlamydomonas eustigma]|uniref:RNA methyltransferase At5g10620 n=1 Tax=Chlamydomonas eustigma TaxID=1157962 RepID=A0A250WU85_9CHLO|nr:hypothetical protein CEUSTIGMA_g1839.t1 [Chlamydomonas eustigma]|eukprot:GAX74391.1 hypothetical protein CEUSTIGMA_g1839.t1 [Chlamydomonas eustigma]